MCDVCSEEARRRNVFELSRLRAPNSLRESGSDAGLYVVCPPLVLSCLALFSSLHPPPTFATDCPQSASLQSRSKTPRWRPPLAARQTPPLKEDAQTRIYSGDEVEPLSPLPHFLPPTVSADMSSTADDEPYGPIFELDATIAQPHAERMEKMAVWVTAKSGKERQAAEGKFMLQMVRSPSFLNAEADSGHRRRSKRNWRCTRSSVKRRARR